MTGLIKVANWLNGWRPDLDGWLVRARRPEDPASLPSDVGFTEESSISVRTHDQAFLVDQGRI